MPAAHATLMPPRTYPEKTHIHDKISPEPAESLAVGDGLLLEVNSG
jgi:hypothetical protein